MHAARPPKSAIAISLLLMAILSAVSPQTAEAGSNLLYRFVGARTSSTTALTAVHCTNLDAGGSVSLTVSFLDPNGSVVGSHTMTLGIGSETRTFVGHLFSTVGNIPFYFDPVLVPLSTDLDQGSVEIVASNPNLVCSAQILDTTSQLIDFAEPLHGVRMADPTLAGSEITFTGVRVFNPFIEAVVHCSNVGTTTATTAITFRNRTGAFRGTTGSFQVAPSQTHTTASGNTALYREDAIVTPTGPVEQGHITVALDATTQDLHCTAELVPSTTMPPGYVLRLGSLRIDP